MNGVLRVKKKGGIMLIRYEKSNTVNWGEEDWFWRFCVGKCSILMVNFFEKYCEILSSFGFRMVPSKKFYLNHSPVKKA